mmetsp:Transcript_5462/g.9142  ORF Transcript_5462/g.9142 Transcript_5462/m.9142 type:complete len:86 (-) Transcript_5462:2164-2421(-)
MEAKFEKARKMDAIDKKQRECLEVEMNYVQALIGLESCYHQPLEHLLDKQDNKEQSVLSKSEIKLVFRNTRQLLVCHKKILVALR